MNWEAPARLQACPALIGRSGVRFPAASLSGRDGPSRLLKGSRKAVQTRDVTDGTATAGAWPCLCVPVSPFMFCFPKRARRGFTLLEVSLVIGIIVILTAMAMPTFINELERERLPGSARSLRTFLTLISANAAFDGTRYRVRFPQEDEVDPIGGYRQPIVEREYDPIHEPDDFELVTAPWAVGRTLLGDVWCAEVRLGRPTAEKLQKKRNEVEDAVLKEKFKDFVPEKPPLEFAPDGTAEWATFVLTDAPWGTKLDELENYDRLEVIFEGATGMAWTQRPLYDEELALFEEKNWPVVLRQDFTDPRMLTEDDILELRDIWSGQ